MERKVIWSPQSLTDLEGIRDYIARDSEHYALAFVEDILEASLSLSLFPERGRVVPEFSEHKTRELFVKRYRLIYELSQHQVEVLAIIHMSRDFLIAWEERAPE